MDGRVFLQQPREKKYDLIFGDIFSTDMAAPFHLTTIEFYQNVESNLNQEGVFILNVAGKPDTKLPSLIGSVAKTLHSVFPKVKAYSFDSIFPSCKMSYSWPEMAQSQLISALGI